MKLYRYAVELLPYTYKGKIMRCLCLTFFSSFGVPKGQKAQIIPSDAMQSLFFNRKKSVYSHFSRGNGPPF